jgi:hypothetical protein
MKLIKKEELIELNNYSGIRWKHSGNDPTSQNKQKGGISGCPRLSCKITKIIIDN